MDVALPCAQIKSKSSRRSVLQSQEIYFNAERPRERLSSKPITLASETTSRAANRCRTPTFCKRHGASPQCLIYFCPTQRNCQLMTSKPWPRDWEQHASGKAAQKPHQLYHFTHSHLSGPNVITLSTLHVKRCITFPCPECSLENVFFIKKQASHQ